MSRGLGRIERECLTVISTHEATGNKPTTYTVAVDVYQIAPDEYNNRTITDAQHVSVKGALAGLRRKGLVTGCRDTNLTPHGAKSDRAIAAEIGVSISTMRRARESKGQAYANAERCSRWSLVKAPESEAKLTAPAATEG